MKTALLVMCVLGASAAFGQATPSVSAQPQGYTFESHAQRAMRTPLAPTVNLTGNEVMVYAQGELALWEVATPVHEVPLGDSARALRQEHATAKRAAKVYQNQ